MTSAKHNKQVGFTIPELVLSITVASILALVLFTATFYYYANVQQAQAAADLGLESQTVLSQLTENVRLADDIASTNAISDPSNPGGWMTSNPSSIIIVENPAVDSSRNIIYDSDSGFPYKNEYIYFLDGTDMYKRILANSDAPGNTATTTCPAGLAGPTCPADPLLGSDVTNLTFTFYDSAGNSTADATQARSVAFQVDLSKKVFGKTVKLANSTRITLRNQ